MQFLLFIISVLYITGALAFSPSTKSLTSHHSYKYQGQWEIHESSLCVTINHIVPRKKCLFCSPDSTSPSRLDDPSCLELGYCTVKDAGHKGKGLFANRRIPQNSFLGHYQGEYLTQREYQRRYPLGNSEYTFLVYEGQRRDRLYIDARDESKSNPTRFINHSKQPNVEAILVQTKTCSINDTDTEAEAIKLSLGKKWRKAKSLFSVHFFTLRDIEEGEEVEFDYGELFTTLN